MLGPKREMSSVFIGTQSDSVPSLRVGNLPMGAVVEHPAVTRRRIARVRFIGIGWCLVWLWICLLVVDRHAAVVRLDGLAEAHCCVFEMPVGEHDVGRHFAAVAFVAIDAGHLEGRMLL